MVLDIYLRSDVTVMWSVIMINVNINDNDIKNRLKLRSSRVCEYYLHSGYLYKQFRNYNSAKRINL